MIGIIDTLFKWPTGIVVGNLIASAMWATPALIHIHRKLDRHHREHMKAIKERPQYIIQRNEVNNDETKEGNKSSN